MENNIDKLFKSKFDGQEPAFDPAAWDRMEGILETSDLQAAPKSKSTKPRIIWIFFLVLGLLASFGTYHMTKTLDTEDKGSTSADNSISNSSLNVLQNDKEYTAHSNIPSQQKVNSHNSSTESQSIHVLNSSEQLSNAINNVEVQDVKQPSLETAQIFENRNQNKEANGQSTITDLIVSLEDSNKEKKEKYVRSEKSIPTKDYKNDFVTQKSMTTIATQDEVLSEQSISANTLIDDQVLTREILADLDMLKTKTDLQLYTKTIPLPKVKNWNSSLFNIGIQGSARFNKGAGYSIGPYVSMSVGKGFAVQFAAQYDVQDFEEGAQLSVFDKEYSFGSTLTERTFSMAQQRSIRLPMSISKDFGRFSVSSGLILLRVLASEGIISQAGDTNVTRNASVDNELIEPLNFAFHLGGSLSLNRFLTLDLGLEHRARSFDTHEQVSNDRSLWYPSLGLRYKLFKF